MEFLTVSPYLDIAIFVLMSLGLGAAVYFWRRGIRKSNKGDMIAGPLVLLGLCFALLLTSSGSGACGQMGCAIALFGIATVILSYTPKDSIILSRREQRLIGVAAIILGIALTTVL
jgi:hypothetical protein